jgi:hypothetical protein
MANLSKNFLQQNFKVLSFFHLNYLGIVAMPAYANFEAHLGWG